MYSKRLMGRRYNRPTPPPNKKLPLVADPPEPETSTISLKNSPMSTK
jgi:hypothetical protein